MNNYPPEYGSQAQNLALQRSIAQALMAQSQQAPQGRMAGRVYVGPSPLEGIAKIAQAYLGANALAGVEKEQAAMDTQVKANRASTLAQALAASQGSPQPSPELGGGPAMPPDPTRGMGIIAQSQDPAMMQYGMPVLQAQQKASEADEARAFRAAEAEKTRKAAEARQASDQQFREWLQANKAENDRPFYTAVSTPQGLMAFNARNGKLEPINVSGKTVAKSADSPDLQRELAAAKAGGREAGEAQVAAQLDLPRVKANAANSIQLIDQLIAHHGFKTSVGAGLGIVTKRVPGTEAANFHALLDQVKGGAFLEAFNTLKGGGQITEVEGKKATDAITRMSTAQSERDFKKAAEEYKSVIQAGLERAQKKAGGAAPYAGPERRVPPGVPPELWQHMTEDEKKLWQ